MERISANTSCPTAKLLADFEVGNREKASDNIGLAAGYCYAATQFRKALHLHIADCPACLDLEAEEMERAA